MYNKRAATPPEQAQRIDAALRTMRETLNSETLHWGSKFETLRRTSESLEGIILRTPLDEASLTKIQRFYSGIAEKLSQMILFDPDQADKLPEILNTQFTFFTETLLGRMAVVEYLKANKDAKLHAVFLSADMVPQEFGTSNPSLQASNRLFINGLINPTEYKVETLSDFIAQHFIFFLEDSTTSLALQNLAKGQIALALHPSESSSSSSDRSPIDVTHTAHFFATLLPEALATYFSNPACDLRVLNNIPEEFTLIVFDAICEHLKTLHDPGVAAKFFNTAVTLPLNDVKSLGKEILLNRQTADVQRLAQQQEADMRRLEQSREEQDTRLLLLGQQEADMRQLLQQHKEQETDLIQRYNISDILLVNAIQADVLYFLLAQQTSAPTVSGAKEAAAGSSPNHTVLFLDNIQKPTLASAISKRIANRARMIENGKIQRALLEEYPSSGMSFYDAIHAICTPSTGNSAAAVSPTSTTGASSPLRILEAVDRCFITLTKNALNNEAELQQYVISLLAYQDDMASLKSQHQNNDEFMNRYNLLTAFIVEWQMQQGVLTLPKSVLKSPLNELVPINRNRVFGENTTHQRAILRIRETQPTFPDPPVRIGEWCQFLAANAAVQVESYTQKARDNTQPRYAADIYAQMAGTATKFLDLIQAVTAFLEKENTTKARVLLQQMATSYGPQLKSLETPGTGADADLRKKQYEKLAEMHQACQKLADHIGLFEIEIKDTPSHYSAEQTQLFASLQLALGNVSRVEATIAQACTDAQKALESGTLPKKHSFDTFDSTEPFLSVFRRGLYLAHERNSVLNQSVSAPVLQTSSSCSCGTSPHDDAISTLSTKNGDYWNRFATSWIRTPGTAARLADVISFHTAHAKVLSDQTNDPMSDIYKIFHNTLAGTASTSNTVAVAAASSPSPSLATLSLLLHLETEDLESAVGQLDAGIEALYGELHKKTDGQAPERILSCIRTLETLRTHILIYGGSHHTDAVSFQDFEEFKKAFSINPKTDGVIAQQLAKFGIPVPPETKLHLILYSDALISYEAKQEEDCKERREESSMLLLSKTAKEQQQAGSSGSPSLAASAGDDDEAAAEGISAFFAKLSDKPAVSPLLRETVSPLVLTKTSSRSAQQHALTSYQATRSPAEHATPTTLAEYIRFLELYAAAREAKLPASGGTTAPPVLQAPIDLFRAGIEASKRMARPNDSFAKTLFASINQLAITAKPPESGQKSVFTEKELGTVNEMTSLLSALQRASRQAYFASLAPFHALSVACSLLDGRDEASKAHKESLTEKVRALPTLSGPGKLAALEDLIATCSSTGIEAHIIEIAQRIKTDTADTRTPRGFAVIAGLQHHLGRQIEVPDNAPDPYTAAKYTVSKALPASVQDATRQLVRDGFLLAQHNTTTNNLLLLSGIKNQYADVYAAIQNDTLTEFQDKLKSIPSPDAWIKSLVDTATRYDATSSDPNCNENPLAELRAQLSRLHTAYTNAGDAFLDTHIAEVTAIRGFIQDPKAPTDNPSANRRLAQLGLLIPVLEELEDDTPLQALERYAPLCPARVAQLSYAHYAPNHPRVMTSMIDALREAQHQIGNVDLIAQLGVAVSNWSRFLLEQKLDKRAHALLSAAKEAIRSLDLLYNAHLVTDKLPETGLFKDALRNLGKLGGAAAAAAAAGTSDEDGGEE